MFKPEVQSLLEAPLIARLSVIDPNGYPHTVPLWFAVDGDDIVMISHRKTRKVDFLRSNSKASICIGGGEANRGETGPGYLFKGICTAEMRKMLHAPELAVHATAVRVPVLVGHTVSLAVSLNAPASVTDVRRAVESFPGVRLLDEPWSGKFPTPLAAAGIDDILVGRIRSIPFLKNGISMVASGDNLRKGNALNAIQLAERLLGLTG